MATTIMVDRGDAIERLRDGIYVLRLDDALMVKRVALAPRRGKAGTHHFQRQSPLSELAGCGPGAGGYRRPRRLELSAVGVIRAIGGCKRRLPALPVLTHPVGRPAPVLEKHHFVQRSSLTPLRREPNRTGSIKETVARRAVLHHIAGMTDASSSPQPPLRAAIIPVTAFQQNCTLLWCTATMRGAFVDPGGDLDRLKAAAREQGVTIEKILVTHGHIDHCGQAGILAAELGVPIEGPEEADRFWIAQLEEDGRKYGMEGKTFEPGPLAARWRDGAGGRPRARRDSLPRPYARPCRVLPRALAPSRSWAMCCSRGRSGGRTFRAAIIRT
jgi:hypothetical protein